MDPHPIKRYGIKKQSVAIDELDIKVQELELRGYTTLQSGLPQSELEDLRRRLDDLLERQEQRFGGRAALERINEAETLRAPLLWDEAFLRAATRPQMLALCTRMLGDYFVINQQNGIRNTPVKTGHHHQSSYHRDLPYQHFVSSRPLAITALLCLDAFTGKNGATHVLPGSHKVEFFPDDEVIRSCETTVEAPAGAFIVMDSMAFHCAGINTSNAPRRGVNTVFSLPLLRQQIALPANVDSSTLSDPALRRLLGGDAETPRTLDEWFEARHNAKR